MVAGEGVGAFREIVCRHEAGTDFQGIPGVASASSERLSHLDPTPDLNLDDLPFPDRQLSAPYRAHYFSEWMRPLASMRTSKGCPFRCSFCSLWKLTCGKYLGRDPDRIIEELATIDTKFKVKLGPPFNRLSLKPGSKILDIGCGKGFLLYDFTQVVPGVEVTGIDISEYAIEHSKE